ncbi:MAG: hypothetical protein ABIP97_05440 [Chthoniobacterales bacterium]
MSLQNAEARGVHVLTYEELFAMADVVVIIEPISTEKTADKYPDDSHLPESSSFISYNTTFKVLGALKGAVNTEKPFVVLYFNYPENTARANGADFISFALEPIQFSGIIKRNENDAGEAIGSLFGGKPRWLAFLKKRDGGRYESVSDPYDAAMSFQEIHHPFIYKLGH